MLRSPLRDQQETPHSSGQQPCESRPPAKLVRLRRLLQNPNYQRSNRRFSFCTIRGSPANAMPNFGCEQSEQSPRLIFARFAHNRFGEALPPLLVCSQGDGGKRQRSGKATGKAVGKAKAERDDEAMIYLLKPSPLFVAGLTLGVVIATATAVAKIRIKQFLRFPWQARWSPGLA